MEKVVKVDIVESPNEFVDLLEHKLEEVIAKHEKESVGVEDLVLVITRASDFLLEKREELIKKKGVPEEAVARYMNMITIAHMELVMGIMMNLFPDDKNEEC